MGIFRRPVTIQADMCACGHAREAHEHYRRGTECAICDVRQCDHFTAVAAEEYSPSK
ncbi:hypothetical protein [Microbacterium rhizophilus]|uniref:hypothetical protein n=1 Tax=Microbacterium rhizophilus TaxID=3138934 RepID=UPI0031F1C28D